MGGWTLILLLPKQTNATYLWRADSIFTTNYHTCTHTPFHLSAISLRFHSRREQTRLLRNWKPPLSKFYTDSMIGMSIDEKTLMFTSNRAINVWKTSVSKHWWLLRKNIHILYKKSFKRSLSDGYNNNNYWNTLSLKHTSTNLLETLVMNKIYLSTGQSKIDWDQEFVVAIYSYINHFRQSLHSKK